jgi:hypothetical protein
MPNIEERHPSDPAREDVRDGSAEAVRDGPGGAGLYIRVDHPPTEETEGVRYSHSLQPIPDVRRLQCAHRPVP